MTTKTKTPSDLLAPRPLEQPGANLWPAPPWTTEERLKRIEALGERVTGYVQFMCQVSNLKGTSAEAKDKAVAAFYERLAVLERQLGRIQEDLRLG
jgi:hypothetical protein